MSDSPTLPQLPIDDPMNVYSNASLGPRDVDNGEVSSYLDSFRAQLRGSDAGACPPDDHARCYQHESDNASVTDADSLQRDVFYVLCRLRDEKPASDAHNTELLLNEVLWRQLLRSSIMRLLYAEIMRGCAPFYVLPSVMRELADILYPGRTTPTDLTILVIGKGQDQTFFSVHRVIFQCVCPLVHPSVAGEVTIYGNPDVFGIVRGYMYTGNCDDAYLSLLQMVQRDRQNRERIVWDVIHMLSGYCRGSFWQLRDLADVTWKVVVDTL